MKYIIGPQDWAGALSAAIRSAQDGDTIVVDSESKKELALRAISRTRPQLSVTIEVQA